jgi:hypothetical protein
MPQKWYNKASVQTAIISGVFFLIGIAIPHFFQVPTLKDKIIRLEKENKDKDAEIQRIETQLVPFKTLALERFTGDESERLQKLAQEIETLQHDVVALRDYSDIASLNALGKPYEDGDVIFNTPISIILESTWERKDGNLVMRRDEEAEKKYREVIRKFPKFPFAYYFVALCLRDKGDESWRKYAQDAVKILEITTTISGHNNHHDEVLQRLYRYLNEKQKSLTNRST